MYEDVTRELLCEPAQSTPVQTRMWTLNEPGALRGTLFGEQRWCLSHVCAVRYSWKKVGVNFGFDTQLWSSFYPPNHVRTRTLEACPHHDWRACLKGHRPFTKPPAPCGGESITVWCVCCMSNSWFKVYNNQSWTENIGGNFSATKQENMSWKSQQQKNRRTAPNPWQCADGMEIDGNCDECHLKCKMLCWKYLKIVSFPPCSRSCCDDGWWCFRCTWLRLRLYQWDWLSNALRSAWRHIPIRIEIS